MNKLESCCQDLADCCDREDKDSALDALKEVLEEGEKECNLGGGKKHAAGPPADLTKCEQTLVQASQRVSNPKTQAGGKVKFLSPTVWASIIQVAIMVLQEVANHRNRPQTAP